MPKNIFKQGIKLLKIRPPTSSKSSSSSKVDINRNPPRFSKTPESTEVYYFTYAGNLLKEIIENRKSKTSAKFVGIGLLRNHKLVFAGTEEDSATWQGAVGSITYWTDHSNVVFGCVWKYDSAEKEEIDNLEGCPDIYSDFELEVELITDLEGLLLAAKPKEGKYPDSFFEPSPFSQLNQHKNKHGTFLKCLVYKHNNTSDYLLGNGRASPAYKKVMIEGAKQHNFPDFYMKHLDDIQVNDVPITSVLMAKDISEMCGFEIVKKGRGL